MKRLIIDNVPEKIRQAMMKEKYERGLQGKKDRYYHHIVIDALKAYFKLGE